MRFKNGFYYGLKHSKRAKNLFFLLALITIILTSYQFMMHTSASSGKSLNRHQQSANQNGNTLPALTSQLAVGLNKKLPLEGKTIVIDPGHGGKDEGTTGIHGVDEKVLTLKTALVVAKKLKAAGANVVLTRQTDTFLTLSKRVTIAEQNHADAFISMHYNFSIDSSAIHGMSGFFYHRAKDYPLAKSILDAVTKETGFKNRGVRYNDLHVLRENSRPATLIELGFLSNKIDDRVVKQSSYRDQVAQGVYKGLLTYFNKQQAKQ